MVEASIRRERTPDSLERRGGRGGVRRPRRRQALSGAKNPPST